MGKIIKLIKITSPFIYLITFTYSVNLGLIILGLIGDNNFTEVALILGITNLFCSFIGGSIRHNIKYLKITKTTEQTFILLRIFIGFFFIISVIILEFNILSIVFMVRKINEWIIDIKISKKENHEYDFFLLCVDLLFFIFGGLIFFNLENALAFLPWSLSPIIKVFIENQFNILNINLNHFREIFSFLGYDGFAAVPVVIFRHLVDQYSSNYLANILLLTIISGSITGFIIKIIIPLSNNLYIKDIKSNLVKYDILINLITLCFLGFLFSFSSYLSYSILISTIYIVTAIYLRQVLLVSKISVKRIFWFELKLNAIILVFYLFLIFYDLQYIGHFFVINAIINFFFYKSKCLKYLQ